jgi:hypothetical protein
MNLIDYIFHLFRQRMPNPSRDQGLSLISDLRIFLSANRCKASFRSDLACFSFFLGGGGDWRFFAQQEEREREREREMVVNRELRELFAAVLEELVGNDRNIIINLSEIARENIDFASDIVWCIENRLKVSELLKRKPIQSNSL